MSTTKSLVPIFTVMVVMTSAATAQELKQTAAPPSNNYTVLRNVVTEQEVFVPFDTQRYDRSNGELNTDTGLTKIQSQTYSLLAQNNAGEHVVCTGIKLKFTKGTDLNFFTGQIEARDYLLPQADNNEHKTEQAYGSCKTINISSDTDGKPLIEFNNVRVAVTSHKYHHASINIPIIGHKDLDQRRTDYYDPTAFYLGGWGTPTCDNAGYNKVHASAEIEGKINVKFCPSAP